MLQSLTEVYLLVYCLQASATHCASMMSHTPAGDLATEIHGLLHRATPTALNDRQQ